MTAIGSMAVGSIVKIKENGVPVDHIIVQQGLPGGMYDASCDGTWCLRKDIVEKREWGGSDFSNSDICSYFNGQWLNRYDTDTLAAIKQVKIPYYRKYPSPSTLFSGENGVPCQIFLLGAYELGYVAGPNRYFPKDGDILSYFSNGGSKNAYYNGTITPWWTRSPETTTTYLVWLNNNVYESSNSIHGARPALILPSDQKVSDNGTLTFNEPPSAPESLTISTIVAGDPATLTWAAATDPDGTVAAYTLERSVNESAWEQIYTGPELTYTDTIGTGWGTVAYRVYATDDAGDHGPYAETAPQTVQAGILYIAGPAANMGEKAAPFPFQVSMNVSGSGAVVNGIAVTVDFDGYSLYNGTADTGQALTFPMDPRTTGSGAHKLMVTASKQDYIAASETYTFSTPAAVFPEGGLGVQLQDHAARPLFPQTAAALVEGLNGKTLGANLQEIYSKVIISDQDLEAGVSPLEEGKIYLVYE